MRAYHIACNSSNLEQIIEIKGRKLIILNFCKHCARVIESSEIQQPSRIIVRDVTFDNTINTMENRKAVIRKCFPGVVTT